MKKNVSAVAITLACLSGSALAESPDDSFWAELSYFYPTINSTARVDVRGTARPGTTVSLEDELDLDDRKGTPYGTLGMRLGERWRLEFEYYQLNRASSTSIGRQIEWGNATFPVGATLDSRLDTTIYRFTGGYSFHRTPGSEAGVGFGLHVTDLAAALSRQGGVQREARDTLVPLPTVGLYGTYKLSQQFQVRGRLDYLSLDYGDYGGSLVNSLVALDWRFSRNWGAGFGYRYVDYKLEATSSKLVGEINYTFKGPTLFVTAGF